MSQDGQSVFDAADYRAVVRRGLDALKATKPRGGVGRLARAMRCHPTFFSQVLQGKANFSAEQTVAFGAFVELDADETAFLVDMVHRDRAADAVTKKHFEERVESRRKDRAKLTKRWQDARVLDAEQERHYFESWLPQALHMLCRLPGQHTPEVMAKRLGVAPKVVAKELQTLVKIGVIRRVEGSFGTGDVMMHLDAESPLIRAFHTSWRTKAAALLSQTPVTNGTHYSAAISLSADAAKSLRRLMIDHLAAYRQVVEPSADEELYLLALDFCPLTLGN